MVFGMLILRLSCRLGVLDRPWAAEMYAQKGESFDAVSLKLPTLREAIDAADAGLG
jgi:hypothetical protein